MVPKASHNQINKSTLSMGVLASHIFTLSSAIKGVVLIGGVLNDQVLTGGLFLVPMCFFRLGSGIYNTKIR